MFGSRGDQQSGILFSTGQYGIVEPAGGLFASDLGETNINIEDYDQLPVHIVK